MAFKEMMRKAREEKRAADEAKARNEALLRGESWEAPKPAVSNNETENTEEPKIYEVVED